MIRFHRLGILLIAMLALLPAASAGAQTPAPNEIPPLDEFAGIEAAVDRTWGPDLAAMMAATPDLQPEDVEMGVTVLSAMVIRFDTDANATAGFDTFQAGLGAQLLDMAQGGTPTVSDEPVSDLGDAASAVTLSTTTGTPGEETSLRFLLVREGRYLLLVYALAATADQATVADDLARYLTDTGEEEGDEAIFVAEGGSSGGLWGFMPPEDDAVLGGLVPISDELLYPTPSVNA